jgi:hypothetical protein
MLVRGTGIKLRIARDLRRRGAQPATQQGISLALRRIAAGRAGAGPRQLISRVGFNCQLRPMYEACRPADSQDGFPPYYDQSDGVQQFNIIDGAAPVLLSWRIWRRHSSQNGAAAWARHPLQPNRTSCSTGSPLRRWRYRVTLHAIVKLLLPLGLLLPGKPGNRERNSGLRHAQFLGDAGLGPPTAPQAQDHLASHQRSKPGGFVPGFTLNVVVDRRKESVLPILLIVGVRH